MFDAFHGMIIRVFKPYFPAFWQAFWVNGKAVILRGDIGAAGFEINDGLILRTMSVFEFEGFSARGYGEDLISKTNADSRYFFIEAGLNEPMRFFDNSWISWSIRDKNAVKFYFLFEKIIIPRHSVDRDISIEKISYDSMFYSGVDNDDFFPPTFIEYRFFYAHFGNHVMGIRIVEFGIFFIDGCWI